MRGRLVSARSLFAVSAAVVLAAGLIIGSWPVSATAHDFRLGAVQVDCGSALSMRHDDGPELVTYDFPSQCGPRVGAEWMISWPLLSLSLACTVCVFVAGSHCRVAVSLAPPWRWKILCMTELQIQRVTPNEVDAANGQEGEMVRVSDGRASMLLTPSWYEKLDEAALRSLLAAHTSG